MPRPSRSARTLGKEASSDGKASFDIIERPASCFIIVRPRMSLTPLASPSPRLDGGPRQFLESLRGRRILRTAHQSAKRPFAGPQAVLAYLSRYTHRVAISNSRLIALDEARVTFAPLSIASRWERR